MKLPRVLVVSASILLIAACGGGKDDKKKDGKDEKDGEKKEKTVKTYSYDHSKTSLSITTYKHNAKNGVGIDFDSLTVEEVADKAKKIPGLFDGASFEVPVSGLNSGDPERDDKIREHFFGKMENGSSLKGKVKGMEMDGKKGNAVLAVRMNGVKKDVEMDVSFKDKELKLTGTIDFLDWDADKAHESLQKACEEKHTGEDGKTKLWSEVALQVSTELKVKERIAK